MIANTYLTRLWNLIDLKIEKNYFSKNSIGKSIN